jgi:hypothetical protein
MKELLKALANVKKEVGKLSKTETNPFYKSKYFDINSLIEQVDPLLDKNGLLLLQPIINNEVKSIIFHCESGDCIESAIQLTAFNDPQKLGSAITYYRRYTLQSLLGLQAEDDDANKTVTTPPTTSKPKIDIPRLENKLKACTTIAELQNVYLGFTAYEKVATEELKNELKTKLK